MLPSLSLLPGWVPAQTPWCSGSDGEDGGVGVRGTVKSWVSKSCKAPLRCRQGCECSRTAKPGVFANLASYLCALLPKETSPFVPYKHLVTAGLILTPGPSRTGCTLLLASLLLTALSRRPSEMRLRPPLALIFQRLKMAPRQPGLGRCSWLTIFSAAAC